MMDHRYIDMTHAGEVTGLTSFLYKYPRRRHTTFEKVAWLTICSDRLYKLIHAVQAGIADDRERRCTSFCFQSGVFPFLKGEFR